MTGDEFADWVVGYLDGINDIHPVEDSPDRGYGQKIIDRIREKAEQVEKAAAAPVVYPTVQPSWPWYPDRTIGPGLPDIVFGSPNTCDATDALAITLDAVRERIEDIKANPHRVLC